MSSRNTQFDFSDSVVVISGAGRGIGKAIAQAFVRANARVMCADIAHDADIPNAVVFEKTDITSATQCKELATKTLTRFKSIDILINCAVIQPPTSYVPAHEFPEDLWQKMIDVNITGYQNMARACIPAMLTQKRGVIVNLASAHAHNSSPGAACYGPAKAANLMQTKQWALEYARKGIRVVSVSPGAIKTPLVMATLAQQGGEASLANRHPCGRLGNPEEVAASVLFLASDAAGFIYGADLAVDGGLGAFGAFAEAYDPATMP